MNPLLISFFSCKRLKVIGEISINSFWEGIHGKLFIRIFVFAFVMDFSHFDCDVMFHYWKKLKSLYTVLLENGEIKPNSTNYC